MTWIEKIAALSDQRLTALFNAVRREILVRQQLRLARQEDQLLVSTIISEVRYLRKIYSLADDRT